MFSAPERITPAHVRLQFGHGERPVTTAGTRSSQCSVP